MVGRYWTVLEAQGPGRSVPTTTESQSSLLRRNRAASNVLRYLETKAPTHTAKSPNRTACIRGDGCLSGATVQSINPRQPVTLTATGHHPTQAEDTLVPSSGDNKLAAAFRAHALSQIKNARRQQVARQQRAPSMACLQSVQVRYAESNPRNA